MFNVEIFWNFGVQKKYFLVLSTKLFPNFIPLMWELVFCLTTWYFLRGNIFAQFWLFEQPFTTNDDQKFSLLSYDLKNVPRKHFPKCRTRRSQMFLKIGVLNLHAWRPATLLKRDPKICFYVNIIKFFRKAFIWNTSGGCLWKWLKH